MINLTAKVADVSLGVISIEGLILETGEFAIASRQASSLFQVLPSSTQKWLETNLGKDYSRYSVKTNRESIEGKRVRSTENALSLITFEQLLRKLDRKGNITAQDLVDSLVGLSLHQLFSDAFGIKFEKEDRQNWLTARQATKQSFWWLTDDIKYYIDTYGSSNPQFHYMNAFKAMSKGLFGKEPNTIKTELGLTKDNDLNRDYFGTESLRRIDSVQRLAKSSIHNGIKPTKAVQDAITMFNYGLMDYNH